MNELIETYKHNGDGYNPFFIRKDWQVAQLNYQEQQDLLRITKMERHLQTDEIFILLKGHAILIGAHVVNNMLNFEYTKMLPGITYNIPVTTWHNIVMDKEASIIIVEKSNTHLDDVVFRELTEHEMQTLQSQITEFGNETQAINGQ